jgi:hypothetical protein
MLVKVFQNVDLDVDVTITSEDIRNTLNERLVELSGGDAGQCSSAVCAIVQEAWQVLNAITPEMIGCCNLTQRRTIADALSTQSSRWDFSSK